MRTSPLGHRRRHRRVHPEPAGLVRGSRDDPAIAGATHHDGLADQVGPPSQFDRHEERVHVHMEDLARSGHVPSVARYDPAT